MRFENIQVFNDWILTKIKKTIGDVTILVNNAGIVTGKKFIDSGDNEIEKTFKVNTFSHFWVKKYIFVVWKKKYKNTYFDINTKKKLGKAFLPAMMSKNHGHLVTIASMAGIVGAAGLGDYCASKFAAVGFEESIRNELVRLGKTGVKT